MAFNPVFMHGILVPLVSEQVIWMPVAYCKEGSRLIQGGEGVGYRQGKGGGLLQLRLDLGRCLAEPGRLGTPNQ